MERDLGGINRQSPVKSPDIKNIIVVTLIVAKSGLH